VELDKVGGTDLERKVKMATTGENWPAPQSSLYEIAQATFDYNGYREVMPLVWERLKSGNWRIVFKVLVLLDALLKHGSERCVSEIMDRQFEIGNFTSYSAMEDNRDKAAGIRDKAKDLLEMLKDASKLKQIREVADRNKDKYVGVSNAGGGYGNNSGGYGNSGGGGYGGRGGGGGGGGGGRYDEDDKPQEDKFGSKKDDEQAGEEGSAALSTKPSAHRRLSPLAPLSSC
jgi:epsin